MVGHDEAFASYRKLAEYMQANCGKGTGINKCENCPFLFRDFVCLIQRLGLYPNLALEKDEMEGVARRIERLKEMGNP